LERKSWLTERCTGDKLDNLEQETDQKGRKIANLVAKVSSLQTQISSLEAQNDSLERKLQAATRAKAEQFSAYQRQLREMGATLVEQVRHDRSEIKELETRLNSLRKSHGASLISHLVEGYQTWDNNPIQAVQAPSPHSTLVESGRSSRSSREEPFPTPDTASLESADWMEGSDLIAMSKESMDDENGLSGAGA
jgi:seryl-tRNA synthetase